MKFKAREGDLIENFDSLLFDVKGLVHPPKHIVAFLRYFPSDEGKREKNGVTYQKVYSLRKRYEVLKRRFPQYLIYDSVFDELLCEVPQGEVVRHYKPEERLQELRDTDRLDHTEDLAVKLAEALKEAAGVPWSSLGISGSILSGLHGENSDLDLVVYGSESCRRIYDALFMLTEKEEEGPLKRYDVDGLRRLYTFRSRDSKASFDEFWKTESRKVMQGTYRDRDYFMRFIKDWNEIGEEYGAVKYRSVGYARIKALIIDDSESIFTPCKYLIKNVEVLRGVRTHPLLEIASFRGRFCEQAKVGERVIAEGKVEMVKKSDGESYYRLLLGNRPSDQMILV